MIKNEAAYNIVTAVWLLITVLVLIDLVREIMIAIDIKKAFRCSKCGRRAETIKGHRAVCDCGHKSKNLIKTEWTHLFTGRFTKHSSFGPDFQYKTEVKASRVEIIFLSLYEILLIANLITRIV